MTTRQKFALARGLMWTLGSFVTALSFGTSYTQAFCIMLMASCVPGMLHRREHEE
jgi:hypothetical protein